MNKPKCLRLVWVAFVAAALLLGATTIWAATWPGALPAQNLSGGGDIRDRSDIALVGDRPAVVWAGLTQRGIYFTQYQTNGSWSVPILHTPALRLAAWSPALAFHSTQPILAWVEGDNPDQQTLTQTIVQKDPSTGNTQVIMATLFGRPAPDLVIGPDRMHMVFAASPKGGAEYSRGNLYYTYRWLTQTTWAQPTAVVTSSQVLAIGNPGGIWYPRIALSPSGAGLQIVWEQEQQEGLLQIDYSIWAISGTATPTGVVWGSPGRVSPITQHYATRPSVIVGQSGLTHVVWTELVGAVAIASDQYINYRTLTGGEAIRLNPQPLRSTTKSPSWAIASLAIADQTLCVGWHGYLASTGNLEEIYLQCSPDEGLLWNPAVNASDTPSSLSIRPSLALDGAKVAHVA